MASLPGSVDLISSCEKVILNILETCTIVAVPMPHLNTIINLVPIELAGYYL